jgi:hypothetical protein
MFWKWIGWKDYEVPKNRNLQSVSAKNVIQSQFGERFFQKRNSFVTHPTHTHLHTRRTHQLIGKKTLCTP